MNDSKKLAVLNRLTAHYGEQNWWQDKNWVSDCVSMILIQQSTQANAEKALANLNGYLSLDALSVLPISELEMLIRPSGFFRQKAGYIKNVVVFFQKQGGELSVFESIPTPQLRQQLLAIKGVGSETADSMLLYLFKRKVFIADAYARRLFARLGLAYKSYEAMQRNFNHLCNDVSLKQCQEWHACIDEHGKCFRQNPKLDEGFLLQ